MSVSFGFSKKVENKRLRDSEIIEKDEPSAEKSTEYVTSLEDKELQSNQPKEKKKEFVIPLIKNNDWRKMAKKKEVDQTDEVESQAVQEIMNDAAKQNETWDERGKTDLNLSIPLLMQNKIPEGYETDEKLDVSLRAEEPEDADFDEMPIDQFGFAMLRGMGWEDGEGVGKSQKSVAPVEAVLRPKGMGLGADRRQATLLNNSKMVTNKEDEREQLILKVGTHCVLQKGPHKDLYGTIEGLDEDNARVMVKLSLGGKMVTQSQYNIKLVDKTEFNKYSKYINKGKTDKYKEKEAKKREREEDSGSEKDDKRHRKHRHDDEGINGSDRDSHRDREKRHKDKKQKHRDRDREERKDHVDKQDKYSSRDTERKHKSRRDESNESSSRTNGHNYNNYLWVRPQIRVRIISDKYKKGKYFNTKVDIIDVISPENCVCRTDNGTVLEEISQSDLETVIPKSENSFVTLVSGKHRGQLGEVIKKDKKTYKATVQLLRDRDEVIQVDYDSICEYTGNIHEEFDY